MEDGRMGRTCGTYGAEETCVQVFLLGNMKKTVSLVNQDVNRRVI